MKKNAIANAIKLLSLAVGALITPTIMADGFTEVSGDADYFYFTRLVYRDTITMPNDSTVTINLSDFDSTTLLPGQTLDSVCVTVRSIITGANVQMDNDDVNAQTGTARVQNLVNSYSGPSTIDGSFNPIIEALDMQLNVSQAFNLFPTSGDAVGVFNATLASDYVTWSPGVLQAGDSGIVNPLVYATNYVDRPNDRISFSINSTYTTSATFSGSNGFFQGNTPTGQFFAEVEYIIIPEPGTIGLMAIALGSAGAFAFLRRRKKA